MKTQIVYDIETQTKTVVEIDDAFIRANRPNTLEISIEIDDFNVGTEGTITVQLMSPELSNGERVVETDSLDVSMLFGDEAIDISLVDGFWSSPIVLEEIGTFVIRSLSLPSNELKIEVLA